MESGLEVFGALFVEERHMLFHHLYLLYTFVDLISQSIKERDIVLEVVRLGVSAFEQAWLFLWLIS